MKDRCGLCGRPLSIEGEPLSIDCGGDCWGCIGLVEAEHGDAESKARVASEIERGLRPATPGS